MKAIVYEKYGSPEVFELREVQKPVPARGQVLVKIHASSLNVLDWHLMRGKPLFMRLVKGLFRPKSQIIGADVSGIVESIGPGITEFTPGDAVFGDTTLTGYGGFAEYIALPESSLVKKPENISHEEAGAVSIAALTALQGLKYEAKLQPGQKVMIIGASGGVGTFAVQIAKAMGAEVTAVCSTHKIDQAYALGADQVIDYKTEDVFANRGHYDLVFAVNGYNALIKYKRALKPGGRYVIVGGDGIQLVEATFLGRLLFAFSSKKLGIWNAKPTKADLQTLADLIESGKLKTFIDRKYPLAEMPDAMRYLAEGHARAKVVITI
ncbi:MAG: NAD(P)-dependent alcohol dehydrogenase [Roseivirga sp.]|nr:NAD(P)-dependent alcohol dehydrogenase [Roseivirga sp.]